MSIGQQLEELATDPAPHSCNDCGRAFAVLERFGRPNYCPYCGWSP